MSTLVLVASALIAGGLILAWVQFSWRRPDLSALAVLFITLVSAHVLALAFRAGAPSEVVRGLIPVKDVLAVVLVLVLATRAIRLHRWSRSLTLVVVLFVVVGGLGSVGLAGWPTSDVVLSARNVTVAVVGLLTGLLLTDRERALVVHRGVLLVAAGCAYAIIEYFLPVDFVRDVVGVGDYWRDVKQQAYHLSPQGTNLPGNFFTSAGTRRLSGAFGDPLSAGYVAAVWLVLTLLSRRTIARSVCAVLMGVALLLSFTRGGWLLAILALAPTGLQRAMKNGKRSLAAAAGLLVVVVAGILAIPSYRTYVTDIFTGQDDSTKGHLLALQDSLDHDYGPWGDGFGASGGAVGRGTESVLVTVALQVGVVGLAAYLTALIALLWTARVRWSEQHRNVAFLGLCAGIAATMIISEQWLTFSAGWVLGLALGLAPVGHRSASAAQPSIAAGRSAARHG